MTMSKQLELTPRPAKKRLMLEEKKGADCRDDDYRQRSSR